MVEKRKAVRVLLVEAGRPARILMERELPTDESVGVVVRQGAGLGELLPDRELDLMLLDLELPGEGRERPTKLVRGSGRDCEVVVLAPGTGTGDVDEAPALPDHEVLEFLTRPLSPRELLRMAESGEEEGGEAAAGSQGPASSTRPPGASPTILGSSPAIVELLERTERLARGTASVLILGETGSGKGLVARALHEASGRRDKPFVAVNCGAFQETLLESELFGHEKGAFTGAMAAKPGLFELADGGTIFLDEVAEMSPPMQAKLLGVLDTGELRRVGGTRTQQVDVRVVSASNRDTAAEVEAGRFREDLLFRLAVVTLKVPPLRERREDIPALVDHFLDRFRAPGGGRKTVSAGALAMLTEHRWPGNVRELANAIEGLVLLVAGQEIRARDLPPAIRPASELRLESPEAPLPLKEIERLHVARTLRYTEGKKAPAARLLGIDVKTLGKKIKDYDIET